ncbi:MAG: tRNA pseudouridine(55) synthase TruB, partial [Coriobacteriia bacterium]|nr:tRNA pseudouridine(55) synthase TruB [Coriobacteriia bacterium]
MTKRGESGLSGVLLVDKPAGMTSHDVVAIVRRAIGEKRVGHAGTLDPDATGLLVMLVGPATRLEPFLSSASKAYSATISFGAATDTDDAAGATIRTAAVPDELFDEVKVTEALSHFMGMSEQMPPAYSAIKVGGVTAHRAARAGDVLKLQARHIEVFEATLTGLDRAHRTWDVRFDVSKGTYIRALARDIGEYLDSAAHLSALRRTRSGALSLDDAHSIEAITETGADGIAELFCDPVEALDLLSIIEAPFEDVSNGRALPLTPGMTAGTAQVFAVVCGQELKALYRHEGE